MAYRVFQQHAAFAGTSRNVPVRVSRSPALGVHLASASRSHFCGHRPLITLTFRPPASASRAVSQVAYARTQQQQDSNSSASSKFLDEEAMLAASTFPISPEDLIATTKNMLDKGLEDNPEFLSDDFQFVAPVVGPLTKERFIKAVSGFGLTDGFPDLQFNFHHFRVDPFEPNRVWFTSRMVGTNTGQMGPFAPTDTRVMKGPEAYSMTFTEEGLCSKLTLGYVIDREIGNTGGLGGTHPVRLDGTMTSKHGM
ncbi:hypothetical protein CYMTET_35766 [Cymbomonas tetramitiformis]|uniref:Uncharacterized protein n=1 Tax=Cymbomonas tetramitiformis TaxID=36881 RepID=A0AAE0F8J0_9CHLO|nr:hypothetical protein CYMTET_35766 [Cymbomonas tetramitiformis]